MSEAEPQQIIKPVRVANVTLNLVRANPGTIYVFNDYLDGRGLRGQAAIRDEPNAFGVPTKRFQSLSSASYFTDNPNEILAMRSALRQLYRLARTNVVAFPISGLGTGLTMMQSSSPEGYKILCDVLAEHFDIHQQAANGPVM